MAIDTTSAMQDYLATLDALAYGRKESEPSSEENDTVQEEQSPSEESVPIDEPENVVEPVAAVLSEPEASTLPEKTVEVLPAPETVSEPEPEPMPVPVVVSEPVPEPVLETVPEPEPESKPIPEAIPEPEPDLKPAPAVNPAQAYRIAPPPGYEDSVMAIGVEEPKEEEKPQPEKKKASRYVYTGKQISDDAVHLPAPTLRATITNPSESEDMNAVENFFHRNSGYLYDARPGRKPGQLFQDRDETLSAILDKDKDISYDEAIEIRKLFEEVKEIHSPTEHTIFDDIGPIGEVEEQPQVVQNPAAPTANIPDAIVDDVIFEDAVPGEEQLEEQDSTLAKPVETKLTGCMPLMVSRFSSDEEGSVGRCVMASLDPTVVGYNILKLLRGTMIGILGVEIEGTVDGDECLLTYTRKDDILKAAVEKKHGKGLMTEAAEERGEPSNLRVTDITGRSKKVIREEIPVMPYETVGDLMPHDLVASFARVIFTNRGNDYMIVMSRTSPDLGVSWDRINNDEPVKGLPIFSVILSAELAAAAIRDFSRAGVVIAKKASPSSDLAYKYEAFEVTDNGNIIHAFPKQARNMAQVGRA